MKNILIVEDDKTIISLLAFTLSSKGYNVITANDGQQGYEKFKTHDVDLIVTDAMMPNIDGYHFVKLVRIDSKQVPIIMLTELRAEENKLAGFEARVNDYLAKPFSIEVLVRRIENQLAANYDIDYERINEIVDGELRIDLVGYSIYVREKEVKLTKKEFLLLSVLVTNHGEVMSREHLINHLWGDNYLGDARNIDTHIKNVRRKIENDNIKTVKGIGYMYEKIK